jgi:hypothetical protein
MMRILGGWIALTPELDVKLLLGRHVWDCAQHADLWGRRLPELRAPAQESEPASDRVVRVLDLLEGFESRDQSVERVTAVYRVLKPHLVTVYRRHLAVANPVYEPPTRRILERCIEEEWRHAAAGAAVLARHLVGAGMAQRAAACERRVLAALAEARGVTGDVEEPLVDGTASAPDPAAVAQDLVEVPPPFDPGVAPADLAERLGAHAAALARGDLEAAERHVLPEARTGVRLEYARLRGPWTQAAVAGVARIGRYRVTRLRLDGVGQAVVQERWVPGDDGWMIAAAEVARLQPGG